MPRSPRTSARRLLPEDNINDQIHLARAAMLSYNFTSARDDEAGTSPLGIAAAARPSALAFAKAMLAPAMNEITAIRRTPVSPARRLT
jgi:hypothetical protein